MKTLFFSLLCIISMALLPSIGHADVETVLEFDTMVGVSGPFLGDTNPIRDIRGGGAPWVLDEGRGKLKSDGHLRIDVEGLIIPESAGRGFNPAEFFRAAVSCITVNRAGKTVIRNIFTKNGAEVMRGDPTKGDARIRAKLRLPNPCIAPIVFVTSPTGSWFAVTGVEKVPSEKKP